MKLADLKKEIEKYQYFEDTDIIDVSLSSVIATRLSLGDPIWLILIGPSSGGKSQILRPIALTDPKFLHRVDDLTENTFLSGANLGNDKNASLLLRIGNKGMIVMSDLTVLFSKNTEARATILSQFRMLYDGEMVKFSGNKDKPVSWKGYLGILAGSTPSIYAHFEEVSDMGERFIYYRMKDYSAEKATRLSMSRKIYGKDLDEKLGKMYAEYIKEVVENADIKKVKLSPEIEEHILQIAMFAEKVRTVAHLNFREQVIDRVPVSAMPMRVALQLTAIAKALQIIRTHEGGELNEKDTDIIDWCGYSLANEEKRACLKVLAGVEFETYIKTSIIADKIGLSTSIVRNILQNLSATGVLQRGGTDDGLSWTIKNKSDWEIVRRIEKISEKIIHTQRAVSDEEGDEKNEAMELEFKNTKF